MPGIFGNATAWGQSQALRKKGEEPSRWHWVYGGTCFRLSQRSKTAGGRALILSRGYGMTRGGIEALKEQLWAEAMRHGLGQAKEVLVVADGAVWIWNLVADRFAGARQRLDSTMSANISGQWRTPCTPTMKRPPKRGWSRCSTN